MQDVSQQPLLLAGQFIGLFGLLAMAASYALASLNAMRVGLLTRGMGIIGMLVGLLAVFPVALLSQLVPLFWLFALTWLLLDRWPGGSPPAWRTGRAEPWPSAAEQRQARAGRGRRPAGRVADAEPDPEPDADDLDAPGSTATRAHPSSKKRKRKRRG